MDEPVVCWRCCPRFEVEPDCIVSALEIALIYDDKNEYLRLIKLPDFERVRDISNPEEIFRWDALECGIAVLNGETKGITDFEGLFLEEGLTPLQLAALYSSVRLTKYLLERGDCVDFQPDVPALKIKQGTFIDFIIKSYSSSLDAKKCTPRKSVYELLVVVCSKMRPQLEVLRMLIRNTQNKERVRQTFMDYADKRELIPVALLFLAVPELFLSSYLVTPVVESCSIAKLYHVFNSLEKRTDIDEAMLLLLDAFAIAADKFVAYTRLQYRSEHAYLSSYLDVAFLVREVVRNKRGLCSADDYFLSFFKPMRPEADPQKHESEALPFEIKRYDLDQAYINRVLPSLTTEDADRLNNAIEKKLSLIPTLYGSLEDFIELPKQGVRFPFQGVPFPFSTSFESSFRSLVYMASAKCGHFKNTPPNSWRNGVMKPTKLNSQFSRVGLSRFSNIAKRLIK